MSAAPHDEERLGELLAMLPPAPTGWVQAAQELPEARRQLDEIVERAREDAEFRVRLIADLEAALTVGGLRATPRALRSAACAPRRARFGVGFPSMGLYDRDLHAVLGEIAGPTPRPERAPSRAS